MGWFFLRFTASGLLSARHSLPLCLHFNCGGDDLITEEYLRRSHLFRRVKNGPHGQIVELTQRVLSRTSSRARARGDV
jgi:hypothetical protein